MSSPKRRSFLHDNGSPKRLSRRRSGLSQELRDLELAVIHNDVAYLQKLLPKVDINTPLNEKRETALMVAIKLSHIHIIQVILAAGSCDLAQQNINNYAAFDIAIITTFDNRREPRHSVCWEITALLMRAGAEPACQDAMLYVIRTAMKMEDAEFMVQFISACTNHSSSRIVHELLLLKLQRNQPLYMVTTGIDHFLELASFFTVKLIKTAPVRELEDLVQAFDSYLECHWVRREFKTAILQRLIVYFTAAGCEWSPPRLASIGNASPGLAEWCRHLQRIPKSMAFYSRLSFRKHCVESVQDCLNKLAYPVPDAVKDYVLLHDVDLLFVDGVVNLRDVRL